VSSPLWLVVLLLLLSCVRLSVTDADAVHRLLLGAVVSSCSG